MHKRLILLVEWEDIATYGKWCKEEDSADVKPMVCYSIGWKVKAPKGKLCITSNRNSFNECADRTVIPRANVRRITYLKEVRDATNEEGS